MRALGSDDVDVVSEAELVVFKHVELFLVQCDILRRLISLGYLRHLLLALPDLLHELVLDLHDDHYGLLS